VGSEMCIRDRYYTHSALSCQEARYKQDYFLFFEDGTIEYWFLDWFDGATLTLSGHDYEVMAQVRDILEGVV
jgi:hypothetical protein